MSFSCLTMKTLYSESVNKIRQNKTKLEKALKVKLSFSENNITIDGSAVEEYLASEIIDAINLGFKTPQALLLTEEGFILEKINIKDITHRHDLTRIRGRIIGTRGKTKEIIENLSNCQISLHDNTIGIIGRAEQIKTAMQAITSIIQGSKQSKVYSSLERERAKSKTQQFEDLGLRKRARQRKTSK